MKKIMIRRLGVASVAKYVGLAQALLGFVYGFFAMLTGLAVVISTDSYNVFTKIFGSIGVILVALVVLPGFCSSWAGSTAQHLRSSPT